MVLTPQGITPSGKDLKKRNLSVQRGKALSSLMFFYSFADMECLRNSLSGASTVIPE